MTDEEKINKAIDLSAELYNTFTSISKKHVMDDAETCRDIHNIQNRLISIAYKQGVKINSKLN